MQTICDRIAILNKGVLQVMGNVRDLLSKKDVIEFLVKRLPEDAIQAVESFIKKSDGEVLSVKHPVSTLEELFVKVIQDSK